MGSDGWFLKCVQNKGGKGETCFEVFFSAGSIILGVLQVCIQVTASRSSAPYYGV